MKYLENKIAKGLMYEATGWKRKVQHYTANKTLESQQSGSVITNLGATDTVTITLPQGAAKGVYFTFITAVAQSFRIDPGDDGGVYATISGTYGKQTDDKYIQSGAIGSGITLVADGNGDWVGLEESGTAWTVQA